MFKMHLLAFCTIAVASIATVECIVYGYGHCPMIPPMHGFNMSEFLGVWYGVQKSSSQIVCGTYNYTRSKYPDTYISTKLTNAFDHGASPSTGSKYRDVWKFIVPNTHVPGYMLFSYPPKMRGTSHTVLATDYVNYAAVFICIPSVVNYYGQIVQPFASSVTIFSKRKTIDAVHLNFLRRKLRSLGLEIYYGNFDLKSCFGENNNDGDFDLNVNSTITSPDVVPKVVHEMVPEVVTNNY